MKKLENKAEPVPHSTSGGERKHDAMTGRGERGRDAGNRGGRGNSRRNNNSRNNNNNNSNRRVAVPVAAFTGEVKALDGCYFDSSSSYRADTYETSIKALSAYAVREYTYGTDIRHVINKLAKPTLKPPEDPGTSETDKAIWKEEVSRYVKRKGKLEENIGSLYSLVTGQCTDAMKAKLSGLASY